jgi:hypothetical protein
MYGRTSQVSELFSFLRQALQHHESTVDTDSPLQEGLSREERLKILSERLRGLPNPREVQEELKQIQLGLEDVKDVDVRLRVHNGSWQVLWGDSSYDTDHRGYWGASSISDSDADRDLYSTAKDLISQVEDHYAQMETKKPETEKWALDEATETLVNGMKKRITELEGVVEERENEIGLLKELNEAMDELKRREGITEKMDALFEKYPQLKMAQHILDKAETVEQLERLADECLSLMLEERKQRNSESVDTDKKGGKVKSVPSAAGSSSLPLTEGSEDSLSRLADHHRRKNLIRE